MGLASGSSSAQAQDWNRIYKGGTRTANAGAITGGAGLGATLIGFGLALEAVQTGNLQGAGGAFGLMIVGGTAFAVGPAMMAGGSVRANRALQELGYEKRSPVLGYVTWGLWGSTWLISIASAGADEDGSGGGSGLSGLTLLGSYVTGAVQMGQNGATYNGNAPSAKRPLDSPMQVQVIPITYGDTRGVVFRSMF
jgi:hypothetical protein